MPATAISATLTKWDEARKKGVFTAKMEWTLKVSMSATIGDMAPSKIAGLFAGLPVEGTVYTTYNSLWPLCTCRGVSCNQIEGGVYLYETEWSDENSKDSGGTPTPATNENPLLDLPIIKPVGGMRDRAITRDRNDEVILNKAGDPVAQSIEDNTISISVTVNVDLDDNPELLVLALRNRVNAAPIQVGRWFIDTNMARVVFPQNFLSEVKRRNGTEYFEFQYELVIDERDKHNGTPLNAGFRQRAWVDGSDNPIVAPTNPVPGTDTYTIETILNADASEPGEPCPLDAFGRKIETPEPDSVIYLEVEKYEEGDFTQLPGVTTWAGP